MAQTLRSKVYNQMAYDVDNAIGNVTNALNSAAQAKKAYDQGFYDKIETQMDMDYYEYQNAIIGVTDPEEVQRLQDKYVSKMDSYIDSLKVPKSVMSKWSSTGRNGYLTGLKQYADKQTLPNLWNHAKADYDNEAELILSNGDLDANEKRVKLEEIYSKYSMADAPYDMVGKVNTPDDWLKAGEGAMTAQYIDRYYASLPGGQTQADFNEMELAEKAVSELEAQLGTTFDVSARSAYKQTALNEINKQEAMAEKNVATAQNQFTMDYLQRIRNGETLEPADMIGLATEYGAINPDGSMSKYWQSWFANNLNILTAVADYEKVMGAGEEGLQTEIDETVKDVISGDSAESFINSDGSANWSAASGKKTYSFGDGSSVSTYWSPMVEKFLDLKSVSRDSKEAVTAVVNMVNAMGNAGRFEDPDMVAVVEELAKDKANPQKTLAEYQNKVMSYITNGWITQEEADDLDLWNPDTKKFQSMQIYSGLSNYVDNMLKTAFTPSKGSSYSPEENNRRNSMQSRIMAELERQYYLNPANFNPGTPAYDKEIEEAYKKVVHEEQDKLIDQATSIFLSGGLTNVGRMISAAFGGEGNLPASQRTKVQTITKGFYDPNDENYRLFHYLTDDIQEGVNSNLVQFYGQKDKNKSDESLSAMRDLAANVYNKSYEELDDVQKSKVDAALLRAMYENDVQDVVSVAFDVPLNSMQKIYIYGIGPGYVDKRNGTYYATDQDPATTSMYFTGTLTKDQLDKALRGEDGFNLEDLTKETVTNKARRIGGRILKAAKTAED